MKEADICYVISNGFSARMLFQTELIPQIADTGQRIALLVPDKEDPVLKAYGEHENIALYEVDDPKDLWSNDYKFKRKYYLEEIKSNPALWEKHIHSTKYNSSKHPWRRIRPFIYYLIYLLVKWFPAIRTNFIRNEKKYLYSAELDQLLKALNPKLVVSTYPVNLLEARVLFAAKQLGKKTLIHLLSWDNISCKGHFPVLADHYIAWGQIMEEELKAYYNIADENIFVCGVPHFDVHHEVKCAPEFGKYLSELELNADAPYLFVAMSSPHFAPGEIEIVEWLAKQVEAGRFGNDMQLLVRPHPQNVTGNLSDKSWLSRLKLLDTERVKVDYPKLVNSKISWSMAKEDMIRLSNLLAGASVVINSGSTVSIDALSVGKPVIISSFDGEQQFTYWRSARRLIDFNHLRKFVDLGGVSVAYDYKTFNQHIQLYLKNPAANMENREKSRYKECGVADGLATKRVLDVISEITRRN